MTITTWLQSSAALTLAITLLHSLWQSAVAALLLAACLRFTQSARVRYAAACGALAAIVVAAIGTFVFLAPSAAPRHRLQPAVYSDLGSGIPYPSNVTAVSPRSLLQTALPWITPAWFLGFLLFTSRQIGSWAATRRVRQRGVCVAPDAWQRKLDELQGRMMVSKPVLLLESCLTQVPLVVGQLRPAILVPIGFLSGLPAEQVELLLIHELAHIRRADYAINILQTFAESVMFYNPAVWWISNLIRIEREHCCDDAVVEATNNACVYAAALTALEENRSRHAQLAMAATGGPLMTRIRRVLHQPEPSNSIVAPILGALTIMIVITGLLMARPAAVHAPEHIQPVISEAQPTPISGTAPVPALPSRIEQSPASAASQVQLVPQSEKLKRWVDEDVSSIITAEERAAWKRLRTDEERLKFIEQRFLQQRGQRGTFGQNPAPFPAQTGPQTPFERWLNEDAAYIITAEERVAYLRLSTDSERERFIEQFWLVRDPTPGTPLNEYKDEHYARIAYANEHFGTTLTSPPTAGWRTDRGRIYIMYGKADELESHPSGGKYDRPIEQGGGTITTSPFEVWRYRYIEGIGTNVLLEFVDANGTGEFRQTIDPSAKQR
jgi:GWxTD domain-containing protein